MKLQYREKIKWTDHRKVQRNHYVVQWKKKIKVKPVPRSDSTS